MHRSTPALSLPNEAEAIDAETHDHAILVNLLEIETVRDRTRNPSAASPQCPSSSPLPPGGPRGVEP